MRTRINQTGQLTNKIAAANDLDQTKPLAAGPNYSPVSSGNMGSMIGHRPSPQDILFLQRTVGNRAAGQSVLHALAGERAAEEAQDRDEEEEETDVTDSEEGPEEESKGVTEDDSASLGQSLVGSGGSTERAGSAHSSGGMCSKCQDEANRTPFWGSSRAGMSAGEPSISIVQKAKSLTKCGSAESKVKWSVSGKRNGWIIQHVKFRTAVTDCKGKKRAPLGANGLEYWEGWEVKNGNVFVGFAAGGSPHNADTFRTVDEGNKTKGRASITGRVRFLRGFKLNTPPWGFTVPAAMSLPTMTVPPKGWHDAGAARHTLRINWNCCGATQQQTVRGRPSPKRKKAP